MWWLIRQRVKESSITQRRTYDIYHLQNSLYLWEFDKALRELVFSQYDCWWRVLLFGCAAWLCGNVHYRTIWEWNIVPRLLGYVLALSVGLIYDRDDDQLLTRGDDI